MVKNVGCFLIITLVFFLFSSCGENTLTEYCYNVKKVHEEWDKFKEVTIKEYSDIGFLKVWH